MKGFTLRPLDQTRRQQVFPKEPWTGMKKTVYFELYLKEKRGDIAKK